MGVCGYPDKREGGGGDGGGLEGGGREDGGAELGGDGSVFAALVYVCMHQALSLKTTQGRGLDIISCRDQLGRQQCQQDGYLVLMYPLVL